MMNGKTELVKEAKNDKASRCCWSAYQKKIRQNGIRRNATQPWNHTTTVTRTVSTPFDETTHNPKTIFTVFAVLLRFLLFLVEFCHTGGSVKNGATSNSS